MSRKERRRLVVLDQVKTGALTLKEGAERMGVCYRQAKRVWKRWREEGEEGLVHRSRGGFSNRRSDPALKSEALRLYDEHYEDFGPTLAAEKLAEKHGVKVNRETLRRWLLGACLWPGKTKARRHRRRRPRREHFGEVVQMDGSHHAWFEDRAPACCLMVMVDDATGRSLVRMAPEETTEAAFRTLRRWIERHGVPAALYVDRKNIYVSDREPTPEEKRAGTGPLTDFGRACWRLGIEIIPARSPQAKGRVERRNGVLQDRLVKELRLRGISDIESANAMVEEFTEHLDARLARPPAATANYHRALPPEEPLEEILCWEAPRRVQNDWTIAYEGRTLQIERQEGLPPAGARVAVRKRLDGSLAILWGGRELRFGDSGGAAIPNKSVTRPPWGAGGRKAPSPSLQPSP
jgi:transposase